MEWWSWIVLVWAVGAAYWIGHYFGWRQRDRKGPREIRVVRQAPRPTPKPSREPGVKGHARVTEAHLSQPRTFWRDGESAVDD